MDGRPHRPSLPRGLGSTAREPPPLPPLAPRPRVAGEEKLGQAKAPSSMELISTPSALVGDAGGGFVINPSR